VPEGLRQERMHEERGHGRNLGLDHYDANLRENRIDVDAQPQSQRTTSRTSASLRSDIGAGCSPPSPTCLAQRLLRLRLVPPKPPTARGLQILQSAASLRSCFATSLQPAGASGRRSPSSYYPQRGSRFESPQLQQEVRPSEGRFRASKIVRRCWGLPRLAPFRASCACASPSSRAGCDRCRYW
jgi:hypothetical protein